MKRILALAAMAALMTVGAAGAAEHEIHMLNKGEKGVMVFEPDFVQAEVGDTIRFVAVDKGHNAEAIKGMVPDGVKLFKAKINEELVVTLDAEGVYGIKCTPHYSMGMVMVVVAGAPTNLDAAKAVKHPGKAKTTFEAIFAEMPTN